MCQTKAVLAPPDSVEIPEEFEMLLSVAGAPPLLLL